MGGLNFSGRKNSRGRILLRGGLKIEISQPIPLKTIVISRETAPKLLIMFIMIIMAHTNSPPDFVLVRLALTHYCATLAAQLLLMHERRLEGRTGETKKAHE